MKLLNNAIVLITLLCIFQSYASQECKQGRSQPDERFVIFAEQGLVRDRVTGLLWQRCSVGQFWNGQGCEESSKRMITSWFSWDQLDSAIERTIQESGQHGWRVPSIDELQTLVDFDCQQPAINANMFPNTANWRYWSSTAFADNPQYIWTLDFATGTPSTVLKPNASYHVRLVKGKTPRLNTPKAEEDTLPLADWNDGIHNLANPDLIVLQPKSALYQDWPLNEYGEPDWAALLRKNVIAPRVNMTGQAEEMAVWQHDIIFKDTQNMPWVKFPHQTHSQWLACSNCHDGIFSQRTGSADISMGSIYSGQHCGTCHGVVAFTLTDCARCHSQMHSDVSPTWRLYYKE
jgi:c(7)-type cytochrome triheme protein